MRDQTPGAAHMVTAKKPREKKCKACGEVFRPQRMGQHACSMACAIVLANAKKAQKARKQLSADRKRLNMQDRGWLTRQIDAAFNAWIRHRDQACGHGCITCGASPNERKMDAGHFLRKSSHPALRWDEANVHMQCARCNQHLGGNEAVYAQVLPARIGTAQFERLMADTGKPPKRSIEDLQNLMAEWRWRCKEAGIPASQYHR